jgi:hypothetical protein
MDKFLVLGLKLLHQALVSLDGVHQLLFGYVLFGGVCHMNGAGPE